MICELHDALTPGLFDEALAADLERSLMRRQWRFYVERPLPLVGRHIPRGMIAELFEGHVSVGHVEVRDAFWTPTEMAPYVRGTEIVCDEYRETWEVALVECMQLIEVHL